MTARDTALCALIACRRQNAWSDGVLKEYITRDRLDRRDAALASRLCYGVLQNRMLLDFWIEAYLTGKLAALQPVVLDILRLAVYQLTMTDKIPPSAAVNQAVAQAKKYANPRAAGLTNAVLRSMLRDKSRLTLPEDLSLRYSHPQELTDLLRENIGEDRLEAFLACDNEAPQTFVQINTVKTDTKQVIALLQSEGFSCTAHAWLPDCLCVSGGSIEQSAAYAQGFVYAQDAAARLAVLCALPQSGMRVLDCCSAPGGKSFAAAIAMKNAGQLVSCDIHPHKITLIEKGATRLGLDCIHAQLGDASKPCEQWKDAFDLVIADVPCSGLGVIRKKPDIRYKELAQTERLPQLQLAILDAQAQHVKPGGTLLYSTCTVLCRENEDVAEQFLRTHPDFSAETLPLPEFLHESLTGMLTLYPDADGTDGFFIGRFRRNA